MADIKEIKRLLERKNDVVQQRIGEHKALVERKKDLEDVIRELQTQEVTVEKAVWLLQKYADFQQKEVIEKVETIVTSGLRSVFQNPTLRFKLFYSETKSGTKKKNPEITMAVYYDIGGEEVKGDIENSFGGGLSVVVSTLLRVVIVTFMSSKIRSILLLDEPLKDLSPPYPGQEGPASGYRDRMAEFLRGLVDELGVQVIMVSHEPNYADVSDVDYRFHGSIGKTPRVDRRNRDRMGD